MDLPVSLEGLGGVANFKGSSTKGSRANYERGSKAIRSQKPIPTAELRAQNNGITIPPLAPPAPALCPEIKETSGGDQPNMSGTVPLNEFLPMLDEPIDLIRCKISVTAFDSESTDEAAKKF